ncbi:MAG TPA: SusC/RagA family TonB-linked outer membrane protein [Gemmatimonadaceae bacterium]|jgi:TonB-linked SusC/RagA family outer membrane protein
MAWIRRLGVSAIVLAPMFAAAQQPTGTITGRVIDRSTQQPVVGATIRVVGTTRGAQSGDQGTYRITGVPVGAVQVQALRIGYASITRPLTIAAAGSETLDFTLDPAATTLDVVQVTATGQEQSRRESGVSTATVNVPAEVPQAAVSNLQNVLSSRAAGVVVQEAGGTTGSAARVRIRGSNSVSLSNDPLIIVDGIRVNNDEGSGASILVGGQVASRLNDINQEDIENIEIIKGPAAAALYGTAASNGVIQITTKRGRAGSTKWNVHSEAGTVNEVTSYPANYWTLDNADYAPDTLFPCTLDLRIRGFCPGEQKLVSYNPLEQNSPFIRGWRTRYGADVAGGSELAQYFIGGDFNREQGVYAINRLRQISLRGNVHSQLRDNFDLSINTGYTQSRLRIPQNDNNVRGIIPQGLLGNAIANYAGMGGFGFDTPADIFAINTQQNVDRFTGSARSQWQPLSWLSAIGTAGVDFTNRIDQEFIPPATAGGPTSQFADDPVGKRTSNPFQEFVYTANFGVTGTFNPRSDLRSATSTGIQWDDEITRATFAFGQSLLAGTGSLNGATALFSVGETNVENKTLGAYLQEQLSWREKLFVTGALRGDKNSAFGQDFRKIIYPAASVSWVLGEESFFPRQDYLSSLRLRTAYGESGQRPNFRSAVRFLTPAAVGIRQGNQEQNVAAFFVGGIGNVHLKPELSKEYELGFDAGFWHDRIGTEVTYYSKHTTDAIVARPIPPSDGEATARLENLGSVKNAGLEYSVNAQLFDYRGIAGSLLLNGSTNANKLLSLGAGIPPILFGADNGIQRHQAGYPLGGYWAVPIVSFADKNGDGIISRTNCPTNNGTANPQGAGLPACEVTLGDTAQFQGASPFPTHELAFTPQLTFFKNVTVRALFDHRGGQKLLNFTDRFRDVSFGNSFAANSKDAPLKDQARYIAGLMGTDVGYIEDASFTKFRELSVAFAVPARYVSRWGFNGATLTLAGRNLHTWTNYTGLDPEINENGGTNFSTDEFLSQPQVRYYTIRLDLGW